MIRTATICLGPVRSPVFEQHRDPAVRGGRGKGDPLVGPYLVHGPEDVPVIEGGRASDAEETDVGPLGDPDPSRGKHLGHEQAPVVRGEMADGGDARPGLGVPHRMPDAVRDVHPAIGDVVCGPDPLGAVECPFHVASWPVDASFQLERVFHEVVLEGVRHAEEQALQQRQGKALPAVDRCRPAMCRRPCPVSPHACQSGATAIASAPARGGFRPLASLDVGRERVGVPGYLSPGKARHVDERPVTGRPAGSAVHASYQVRVGLDGIDDPLTDDGGVQRRVPGAFDVAHERLGDHGVGRKSAAGEEGIALGELTDRSVPTAGQRPVRPPGKERKTVTHERHHLDGCRVHAGDEMLCRGLLHAPGERGQAGGEGEVLLPSRDRGRAPGRHGILEEVKRRLVVGLPVPGQGEERIVRGLGRRGAWRHPGRGVLPGPGDPLGIQGGDVDAPGVGHAHDRQPEGPGLAVPHVVEGGVLEAARRAGGELASGAPGPDEEPAVVAVAEGDDEMTAVDFRGEAEMCFGHGFASGLADRVAGGTR